MSDVHEASWSFRTDACEVRVQRRVVVEQVRAWAYEVDQELADTLLLLASELITNGVRYGETDKLTVVMTASADEVFIGVMDGSHIEPVQRNSGVDAPGGRGMELVSALAHSWGTHPTEAGKVVWFTLRVPGASAIVPVRDLQAQRQSELLARIRASAPRVRVRALTTAV